MTSLTETLAGPWTADDQRRMDRFLQEQPSMNARIETIPGAVLATDLPGAEHADHGDTIDRAVELAAEHGGRVLLLDEDGTTAVYADGHMEDFGA